MLHIILQEGKYLMLLEQSLIFWMLKAVYFGN